MKKRMPQYRISNAARADIVDILEILWLSDPWRYHAKREHRVDLFD
ncbi:hypothetical protein HU762_00045 [Pseudomonas sp. SWRI92]|nr:hypothetical protein [Pseudomonas sp. SWRI92]MBC3372313.1 hypothetical protein [Pseudomonas sp. SWRI92]